VATLQIYDRLLQFPLFQGMSRDDLEIVAGHIRFGFHKVAAGRQVIQAGAPCVNLCFLINGTLRTVTLSDDNRYSVVEQMSSPYILQQEAIFGYHQRYTHSFYALTDSNFLTLEKEEVLRLTEDFLVFRLNLMNHLATQSQKLIQAQWQHCPETLQGRIVRFFLQHTLQPFGPKTFYILMERLAEEVNDRRLNVSHVLNRMQASGLIVLHRGRIEIPQMERLLM
jgi:CRP-like cAMP-binding protein